MPKFHVKIFRSGTTPSLPQEFSVDTFVSIDELGKVNTTAIEGPLLAYSPSAVAALLITPTVQPTPLKPKSVLEDAVNANKPS